MSRVGPDVGHLNPTASIRNVAVDDKPLRRDISVCHSVRVCVCVPARVCVCVRVCDLAVSGFCRTLVAALPRPCKALRNLSTCTKLDPSEAATEMVHICFPNEFLVQLSDQNIFH